MRIIVGITGASGVVYGLELVRALKKHASAYVYLIVTRWAWYIMRLEADRRLVDEVFSLVDEYYPEDELDAPISSGSSKFDAVVVCPCSIRMLSDIVHARADNLVARCCLVALKEGRKVILVVRETPLSENMLELLHRASRLGVHIVPACPGFYHRPVDIRDQVRFIVGKVLDILGIEHDLYRPWRMMSGHGSDQ